MVTINLSPPPQCLRRKGLAVAHSSWLKTARRMLCIVGSHGYVSYGVVDAVLQPKIKTFDMLHSTLLSKRSAGSFPSDAKIIH
jgi:hypothetical protein